MKEALCTRAELALWSCQKELYRLRVEKLRNQCLQEKDDVERVEGSFFARLRGNYEEKLGKEKAEALKVGLELERVEKILEEAEEKLQRLDVTAKGHPVIWKEMDETTLNDVEKELLDWCKLMEATEEVIALNNHCIEEGQAELIRAYSGSGNKEARLAFQKNVDMLYSKMDTFLSAVGRVRYIPGTQVQTAYGVRRVSVYGGKTLLFFRPGYEQSEIDLHDFDFRELAGSYAVGDALERKLKELQALEELFRSIAEEKIEIGEELLGKMETEDV